MADPLGFIGGASGAHGPGAIGPHGVGVGSGTDRNARGEGSGGPSFRDTLMRNIDQVNELQQDATRAIEQLQTGERTDVEGVILATQKADMAFKALQSVRNRMMEALEEVKQMRV